MFKATWKRLTHEYQGGRFIHTHGCVRLDNYPGLVEDNDAGMVGKPAIAYMGMFPTRQLDNACNEIDYNERQIETGWWTRGQCREGRVSACCLIHRNRHYKVCCGAGGKGSGRQTPTRDLSTPSTMVLERPRSRTG